MWMEKQEHSAEVIYCYKKRVFTLFLIDSDVTKFVVEGQANFKTQNHAINFFLRHCHKS